MSIDVDQNKKIKLYKFSNKKMNASFYKNKHQLSVPPSYYNNSNKSKPKHTVNTAPSKSFSQSFLNHFANKKSTKNQKQSKQKVQQTVCRSLDTKNKKLSHRDVVHSIKSDKHKVIINAFDNKLIKQAIKAKSQSQNLNVSYSNNFKYNQIQKVNNTKPKNYLRIDTHSKNKSQLFINQPHSIMQTDCKRIKSFSTSKNEELRTKLIGHLQNKSKRNQSNNYSFSQRKKTSQKIEQKLNSYHTAQQELFQKTRQFLSNRQRKQEKSSLISHQNKQFCQKSMSQKRLQYKYAFRTKKGRHVGNPHKVNQDSILVKQNISKKDLHMIAVADGHGPSGHHVSQFVVKSLSKLFSQEINQIIKFEDSDKKNSNSLFIEGPLILPKIYDKIQNDLSCSEINAVTSGCTLVNVIIQKEEILCANVGDSRAVLARQLDKKNWQLIYLSEDHKPYNQIEKKRILKSGGRIHSFKGERGENLGPLRVWLPNQNIQGLAMTRSFGDNISKSVGVTHKPEIIRVKIDQKDKFILVASDGVWEFISNQEILQLIAPYYKDKRLDAACDALLQLAYSKWTYEDDSVVDDISFVLVFLHC